MDNAAAPKFYEISTRLARMLPRSGGMAREAALKNAVEAVESLREGKVAVIGEEIAACEKIAAANSRSVSDQALQDLLLRTGVVFNLSGTYGMATLNSVCMSTLDLISLMKEKGISSGEGIFVHVRAMVLAAPTGGPLGADDAEKLLARLRSVIEHYRTVDAQTRASA